MIRQYLIVLTKNDFIIIITLSYQIGDIVITTITEKGNKQTKTKSQI